MVAAASVAAILGLIFGVPRARSEFSAQATERYSSNSNLEQISDWLTKLLVGAGLVELKSLPTLIGSAGQYLGKDMTVPNGAAFSVSAIVYGSGVGFAAGYLWARLRLRFLLESSDRAAADASQGERIFSTLREINKTSDVTESVLDLKNAAESAVSSAKNTRGRPSPILWVDDYPENNTSLVRVLTSLGVPVDTALSTEEAMRKLQSQSYGLVISDLGRTENGQENTMAGRDLIVEMRQKHYTIPIFIWAGQRALDASKELTAAGATLVTNRTSVLLSEAANAVTT
jgi:CheY-like chemotaxis protein